MNRDRWLAVIAGSAAVLGAAIVAFVLTRPAGLPSRSVESVPALLSEPAGLLGPAEGIVLAPDGIGAVAYGTDEDAALATLTELLGSPVEDAMQPCSSETDLVRHVRWGNLGLAFPGGRFGGWIASVFVPPDSNPLALVTIEGVELGAPVADLQRVYGDRLTWAEPEDTGFENPAFGFGIDDYSPDAPLPEGIGGYIEGPEGDEQVVTFIGGQPCGPD
jgi:hypothetical protein